MAVPVLVGRANGFKKVFLNAAGFPASYCPNVKDFPCINVPMCWLICCFFTFSYVLRVQNYESAMKILTFLFLCHSEPTPAYSLQRESMDREEARLSPHCGGRLIRQLLEESSDPMVSPRFYAYGHSQQYLDDTEVPPSPPNAHSFIR